MRFLKQKYGTLCITDLSYTLLNKQSNMQIPRMQSSTSQIPLLIIFLNKVKYKILVVNNPKQNLPNTDYLQKTATQAAYYLQTMYQLKLHKLLYICNAKKHAKYNLFNNTKHHF